jgi:hypothetical protein
MLVTALIGDDASLYQVPAEMSQRDAGVGGVKVAEGPRVLFATSRVSAGDGVAPGRQRCA